MKGLFTALASLIVPALAQAIPVEAQLLKALQKRYPQVSHWKIEPLGESARLFATEAAEVRIVQLGSRSLVRLGSQSYWYAVTGTQPALVATRYIPARGVFTPQDGKLLERSVLAADCTPLADPQALGGMRAKETLRADQIICLERIERLPAVSRGDEVTVRYSGERVALLAKATAQMDGVVGDSILVGDDLNQRRFRARVTGPKEVQVP